MKIFISYSSHDLKLAERVFGELVRGGADAFQFGKSEVIGKPTWDQVLEWISKCDVFIVLISKHALASRPVREEIDQAHYSYINSNRPDRLVPALTEPGVQPPRLIERFARADLVDYDGGMERLMNQLGLVRRAADTRTPSLQFSLPDVSDVFSEFKRRNPNATVASLFSARAEQIVAGAPRPRGSSTPLTAQSIDDRLSKLLVDWKATGHTLPAPALEDVGGRLLTWTLVQGASGYVLEHSQTADFANAKELYRGSNLLAFASAAWAGPHFRVKALGGPFAMDSAWSKTVSRLPFLSSFLVRKASAPQLAVSPGVVPRASWTIVVEASRYVLERDRTDAFTSPSEVYDGPLTSFIDLSAMIERPTLYYRVRAIGSLTSNDSDWSNVASWTGK